MDRMGRFTPLGSEIGRRPRGKRDWIEFPTTLRSPPDFLFVKNAIAETAREISLNVLNVMLYGTIRITCKCTWENKVCRTYTSSLKLHPQNL